jgi:uncharacterized protein YbaR (Trm112 family)
MKKDLMDIICCPTCKKSLQLNIEVEKNNEIIKGNLICNNCKAIYDISEGIPNLLPKKPISN